MLLIRFAVIGPVVAVGEIVEISAFDGCYGGTERLKRRASNRSRGKSTDTVCVVRRIAREVGARKVEGCSSYRIQKNCVHLKRHVYFKTFPQNAGYYPTVLYIVRFSLQNRRHRDNIFKRTSEYRDIFFKFRGMGVEILPHGTQHEAIIRVRQEK